MTTTASGTPTDSPTDVHSKALAINLESAIYGTFAEIGGGQEVARWFLRVGAASGTVAQTICAYDKTVSDDTYGAGTRYVSKERLTAMLDHEYQLLINRLGPTRGSKTRFFVFADTVATRNFHGDNEQHGWLGIRFQDEPGAPPSDLLIHVNLRDPTADLQQEALGALGVNLIYAAFHQRQSVEKFLAGTFDGLSTDRVEIDVIEIKGNAFAHTDSRCVCLAALRRGMCRAIVFDSSRAIVEPSSVLRKSPLIIERGRVETPEHASEDILRASERQLAAEGTPLGRAPVSIMEFSVRPMGAAASNDDDALLARVDQASGVRGVIVSDFPEGYLLIHYLRRYTTEPLRMVVGVSNLAKLMAEQFYTALPGSLLEGLGRLLASNVKVYVQPMPRAAFDASTHFAPGLVEAMSDPVTADSLSFKPPVDHLYRYMREAQWVVPLVQS